MTQRSKHQLLESTLEKIARILSDRYDIHVFFKGNDCVTEGRNIYLPTLPENCPEELLNVIGGFLDHEAAHLIYTDFNAMTALQDNFQRLWFNILEDARVEKKIQETWKGCGINLNCVEEWSLDQALNQWDDYNEFVQKARISLLIAKNRYELIDRIPKGKKLVAELENILPALKLAQNVPDTVHVVALSKWICEKLGHEFEKTSEKDPSFEKIISQYEELEETETTEKTEFPEEETPGETAPLEETESEIELSLEKGSTEEMKEGEEGAGGEEGEGKGREEGKGTEEGTGEEGKEPGEGTIDPSTFSQILQETLSEAISKYKSTTSAEEIQYLPFSTEHDVLQTAPNGDKTSFLEELQAVKKTSGVLLRKLRNAFLSVQVSEMQFDQEWGRLNTNALPRLLVKGYPKVFKQEKQARTLNCRISLLVDQSGSMRGEKNTEARRSAILFGEFAHRMKIPFEILGFSSTDFEVEGQNFDNATPEGQKLYTRWGHMEINIYKHFTESWKVGHRLTTMKPRCHNYDGEAILFAAKRLLLARKNSKERLILFVLSDGKPEQHIPHCQPYHQQYLHTVLDKVQKAGIECFSVGILTKAVQEYYQNWICIEKAQELQTAQIEILKKALLLKKGKTKKAKKKLKI